MLISRKHRFIFLHINKSAGQSVVNALMPFCARPYQQFLSSIVPYRIQLKLNTKIKRYLNLYLEPQPFDDHIRIGALITKLGEKEFQSYYSFAFVRNPWDRVLSSYTYAVSNPRKGIHKIAKSFGDFNEFVEWHCAEDGHVIQADFVCDKANNQLVSFIGRFEQLDQDFAKVCEAIGIRTSLPALNSTSHAKYRDSYNKRSKKLVAETYQRDIELFGYKF